MSSKSPFHSQMTVTRNMASGAARLTVLIGLRISLWKELVSEGEKPTNQITME